MVSMNGCMKCTLISAIVLACLNVIANLTASVDYLMAATEYDNNANDIYDELEDDSASNFHSDSEWFVTVAAEYEALSSFDKENVYCDIVTIQSDPSAILDDVEFEATAALGFTIVSAIGLIYAACNFCCVKYNKFYGVTMDRIGAADPETKFGGSKMNELGNHRAIIVKQLDAANDQAQKDADMFLNNYRTSMAMYFIICGPMMAVIWLMVVRRSATDGLDCQALFFSCGQSGDCSMDDMMLTVPLNSSLIKMLISYPLVSIGWFSSILSLCFVLGSGMFLALGASNCSYATLSVFMFVYGAVPFAWVYFVDQYMPFEAMYAVIVLAVLPMISLSCYSCFDCIRSCKGQRY